jgi:hypothetical protein
VDERFAKVDERLSGLHVAIAASKGELMKWMLVFWVGAVGAIAALAGVLLQVDPHSTRRASWTR